MSKNINIDSFRKNGFMKVENLFDIELINSLVETLESSKNLYQLDGVIFDKVDNNKFIRYVPQPQNAEPIFLKVVSSKILNIGKELLSEESYFSGIDVHCRAANTEKPTPPHQDSFLACFEDGFESLVTCYISLTGMQEGSANLRFIKGSHLVPTRPHKKSLIRGFSSVIEDTSELLSPELLKNEEIISLDKGECVFFHSKLIHYTNQGTLPSSDRSSIAVRLSGFSARYSSKKQKIYKQNLEYNRSQTIKEGLAESISLPQHND